MARIRMKQGNSLAETFESFLLSRKAKGLSEKTLTTYKDLFDSGVITQEEFDAKKKQLLGL